MRRSPLLTLLAALAALTFLAGCGTSGGSDAADSDAADTTAEEGTSPDDEETTTTEADAPTDDPGDLPSTDDLEALLPDPADLGPDYDVDISVGTEAEDEDDPTQQQMDEACPAFSELAPDAVDNPDEVKGDYTTPDDRGIEISLDPTPEGLDDADLVTELIDAINECGSIEIEDDTAGTMTMNLAAEAEDGYGDYGVRINMNASFDLMGTPLELDFTGVYFVKDGTGVGIFASSGFDPETFEPVPADVELIDGIAEDLDAKVGDL